MTAILSKINNLFHRRIRKSSSVFTDDEEAPVDPSGQRIQRHKHSSECRHIRFNDKVTQIPPNAGQPRRHHSDSVVSYSNSKSSNSSASSAPRLTRSQSVRTRSRSEPTFYVIERRHVKSALHKQKSMDETTVKTRSNSSSQVIRVEPGSRTVVHISSGAPKRCRDYYLI